MRTMTLTQARVQALQARSVHVDVRVYNTTTASWVSLRNLFGLNFIREVTWQESVDDNGKTANISLDRNIFDFSLSPLMQTNRVWNTYGSLVTINVPIKIYAALKPSMQVPSGTTDPDWMEVFWGRIFEIDFSTNKMTLQCRDWLDQLQSLWMECSAGIIPQSTVGYAAQTVMQQLLNYVNGIAVNGIPGITGTNLQLTTLYSVNGTSGTPFINSSAPDDPGWSLKSPDGPYPNSLMSIWSALDNINQQIGWCLRQKWNNNIANWALTWYDPLRTSTTSVYTFKPLQYLNISKTGVHLGDIRNVIQLWYTDVNGNAQSVSTSDSTSISAYGRQFMQLGGDITKNITGATLTGLTGSPTDYNTMLANSLSDLSQPLLDFVVDVPLFPFVELNDIYTFAADNRHFNTDQKLAVIGYTHTIDGQNGKTQIATRGKPSGGVSRWLSRQVQNFNKQLGATNTNNTADQGANLTPNGILAQFTRF